MKRPPPFDPYQVLGVTPAASDAELAAARKALSARHHPARDRTPGAAARFVEIQQAYALLADPARRRAYDEHVERQRRERAAQAEGAQQEQAEAAERARREQRERAQAGEDLAERTRRAEAQRERARREQEVRAVQLRRILERSRQAPNPVASDDVYDLRDPPRGAPTDHASDGAPVERATDKGRTDAASPHAAAPHATPDAEVAREAAFVTSVGLAGAAAVAIGLWIVGGALGEAGVRFLLDGSFYLALLGAAAAVPAMFALAFVATLGVTYPLARPAAAVARLLGSGPAARPAGAPRSLLQPLRCAARRRWIYAGCVSGCLVAAGLILRWSWGLADRPLEERQVLMPLAPLALACDLLLFYVASVWRALGVRNDRAAVLHWRPDREVDPSHDDDEPPRRRRRGTFSTVAAVPSPAAAGAAAASR